MLIKRIIRSTTEARLTAVVYFDPQFLIEVQYSWRAREGSLAPLPPGWFEAIRAEASEVERRRHAPDRAFLLDLAQYGDID